jgi:tRNA-specific 2-thiouridylase
MANSAVRVIVGLSGGVDSAVAALLLREQGYDVEGLFMANWEEDDAYCTTAADYQDARAVARELAIPLHRVDFAQQYRARVFSYFLREYRAGRTPNPDVLCNREIKFGLCSAYADRLGGNLFATGHYARCALADDGPALLRAIDTSKDQSYFLHAVPRARFARVQFPLGALCKDTVREHARRAGLPVCDKPDSTGICFIGERPFAEFLARYLPTQPGPIETMQGQRLGTHRGLPFYTLGQRAGLELGGARGFAEEPWYVADKQAERNALIVVQRHDSWRLETREIHAGAMHWLAPPRPGTFQAGVKLRYRQADQPASLETHAGGLRLSFQEAQRAATPGQFAVLYDGDRCLGGAVIEHTVGGCSKAEQPAAATARTAGIG